jgi:hypothetical protein
MVSENKLFIKVAITEDAQNVSVLLLNNSVLKMYGPYYSCSSNGTPHTNLLIVKGLFKSLSCINTAPVPTVLRIDVPTLMEPIFIGEISVLDQKHCYMRPAKTSHKNALVTAFFSYLKLCYLYGRRCEFAVECISCLE